jgi:hypothetical protein
MVVVERLPGPQRSPGGRRQSQPRGREPRSGLVHPILSTVGAWPPAINGSGEVALMQAGGHAPTADKMLWDVPNPHL